MNKLKRVCAVSILGTVVCLASGCANKVDPYAVSQESINGNDGIQRVLVPVPALSPRATPVTDATPIDATPYDTL